MSRRSIAATNLVLVRRKIVLLVKMWIKYMQEQTHVP